MIIIIIYILYILVYNLRNPAAVSAFLAEDVSPAAHGPQGLRVETPW